MPSNSSSANWAFCAAAAFCGGVLQVPPGDFHTPDADPGGGASSSELSSGGLVPAWYIRNASMTVA
eukprot:7387798-Prymnesium_polylepis.1